MSGMVPAPQVVSTAPPAVDRQLSGLRAGAASSQLESKNKFRDILMESNRIEGIGHQVKGAVIEKSWQSHRRRRSWPPMEPPSGLSATN